MPTAVAAAEREPALSAAAFSSPASPSRRESTRGTLGHWLESVGALVLRDLRLTVRSVTALALLLLVPLIFTFFLFAARLSYDDNAVFSQTTGPKRNPALEPISEQLLPCRALHNHTCYNFAVVPASNSTVIGWVQEVASRYGLSTSVNASGGIISFETSAQLNAFQVAHPNVTQAAYIFEAGQLRAIDSGRISFTVQYNKSCQAAFPGFQCYYQEQYLVPTLIAAMNDVLLGTRLTLTQAFMPHPQLQSALSAFQQFGAFMMFGALMIGFVYFLMLLVNDKELKLRESLKMIGLTQSIFFVASWTVFLAVATLLVLLLIAFGAAFQFSFYLKNSFGCVFFTYWIFSLSLICWAFFFYVFVRRTSQVSLASFVFFILSYVIASGGSYVYYDKPDGKAFIASDLLFFRWVFALLSPVMFYKCVLDLSIFSTVFTGISWSDRGSYTNLWPLTMCWAWMIWPAAVLFVAAVYLDNVMPNEYGVSLPWWYPFSMAYWRGRSVRPRAASRRRTRRWRRKRPAAEGETEGEEAVEDEAEREAAIQQRIADITAAALNAGGKEGDDLTGMSPGAPGAPERNGTKAAAPSSSSEPSDDNLAARASMDRGASLSGREPSSFLESIQTYVAETARSARLQDAHHRQRSSDGAGSDLVNGAADSVPDANGGAAERVVDPDVLAERQAVLSGEQLRPSSAVVLRRLRRVFAKGQVAVDDLCLAVDRDSLTCILGPNGSGKTTTFNMLTGVLHPSGGDAWVYGYSVLREMHRIRPLIGVCPQHDILWRYLTAREHIYLYATLKGIPRRERMAEVERRLAQVDLLHVADKYASQFSGGMRRRLSVALALVGDPQVVYLDEPTTGMDPVMRRAVWDMIAAAKRGRVILHTTHSMEEADVLGDRIAIMYRGQLSVLGSPMHLKNKFGTGYHLTVTCSAGTGEAVAAAVQRECAGAVCESRQVLTSGRQELLQFALPPPPTTTTVAAAEQGEKGAAASSSAAYEDLFAYLEERGAALGVHDFAVSGTSLESVFIKVFHMNEAAQQADAAGDAHRSPRRLQRLCFWRRSK